MIEVSIYLEAKITSLIFIKNEGNAFAVRLIDKKIGENTNSTNSLIFLSSAWTGDYLPEKGDIVLVSDFKDKGINGKNKRKFRALKAKPKDVIIS